MANLAEFVMDRLESTGIKYVFTVPGDYILGFLSTLAERQKIELINTSTEEGAGFAADGYARLNGVGCVAVTYTVGALKLCNPIAGAFAERSPVIVISGAPGVSERDKTPLHHIVGSFDCQRQVFKNITCAQAVLDNPSTAGFEVDRVLEAMRHYKQPVYIELPRDVSLKPIDYDVYTVGTPKTPDTDYNNLEDALHEVAAWLEESKHPVILAGVEIARYQLGKDLTRFAEKHNIPIACTLLSKSTVNETHPLYIGVYAGSSQGWIRELVESSDCLLVCGEAITEATVGYRPSKAFQKRDMVTCTLNELKVRNHQYPNVSFTDFCKSLFKTELTKKEMPNLPVKKNIEVFIPKEGSKLTTVRLFEKINAILDDTMILVADAGDSLLGSSDLTMCRHDSFFSPAFYLTMGWAIPSSLGIKLAKPKYRPIVVVGDGSFQMSSAELSTAVRWKLNPIIFVLNNRGYTTERVIFDGKFNNILDWHYLDIGKVIPGVKGVKVETEEELDKAVSIALKEDMVFVINCIVDSKDTSPALKRIIEEFARKK